MVKGSGAVYGLTFLFQFFAVFMSVFSTFLIKVLVDAFSKTLDEASLLEVWVIGLLSGGHGADYLYAHMWVLPIAIVSSAFLAFFLSMARGLCRFRASSNINKKMQLTLFEHLERQPFAYYKKAKSGDLIQTCTRDVDVFRRFVMMDMNQFAYTFFIVGPRRYRRT